MLPAPSPFDRAFEWLLRDEGERYTDDPADRGGATRYGITRRSLAEWRGHAVTVEDVRSLTREDARRFYLEQFWRPLRCDAIVSQAKAMALFDLAVVLGRRTGVLLAQQAAGVKADGELGPLTLQAINYADDCKFIISLASRAARRFVAIAAADPVQIRFLPGWIDRAMRQLDLIQA